MYPAICYKTDISIKPSTDISTRVVAPVLVCVAVGTALAQAEWPLVVQLIEVTPDKKVVWALRDWETFGPASSTQLLDEPGIPENGEQQR
jgi:hypothetical protein